MKRIFCKVSKKTGAVTIQTDGYAGASCLEATAKLEKGLGIEDSKRELTAEFHNTESVDETQKLGGA